MSEVPLECSAGTNPRWWCGPQRGSAAEYSFKNNHSTEVSSGSEAGSYLRLIDFCITQLKAQGPSRTCTECKEEKKEKYENNRELETPGNA